MRSRQARQKKEIGAPARSEGDACRPTAICAAARAAIAANCLACSSFRRLRLQPGGEGVNVTVEHADGAKCERCWKYTTDVGSRPEIHPGICAECAERGRTVPAVNLRA